ncbi:hypothetical protein ACF1AU_34555 [Streptomyces rubrogriseus]|uniref:hypothetical protein n=1 Tax=Streptomyces rubrogriseus TaxID=194673 RepID=UPI0036FA7CD7
MAESDRERAIEGWVWSENVLPFLALLAGYAGYNFDGTDWQAVELGLEATDDEHPDRWYSYPLLGLNHHLEVHLAQAVDGNEVSVRVAGTSNPELLLRADTLIAAFATRLVASGEHESQPSWLGENPGPEEGNNPFT